MDVTVADSANQQRERQFVAAVCASLSHEIKNCLAIINENAGLMGDLATLATQGRPVDPERHTRIAQVVKKHVRRADQLVRQLNQFAHSGDVASRELDLAEAIHFAVTLFERTAQKAGRRLKTACAEGVMVETGPLGLLQLLWGLFSAAVAGTVATGAADEEVWVAARAAAGLAQVCIKAPDSEGTPPLLSDALFELARFLGGELKQSAAEGITLNLPLKGTDGSPA
jgi:C4-dicarboxylate-specific signal transduction histidine kinase